MKHRLVIGIDGSGKSTLLNGLSHQRGVVALEPTSTPEAREFKARATELSVTPELIDEREQIFLRLNKDFDDQVRDVIAEDREVATTGSSLVTRVSHALMRQIVCGFDGAVIDAVNAWTEDSSTLKPDSIILVHAPDNVIRDRIAGRQAAGDADEKFWGFNSPFFLSRYQEAWLNIMNGVLTDSGIDCLALDSSALNPQEMLERVPSA